MGFNIAARGAPIRLPPNCSGRGLRALRASLFPRGLKPGEKFWRARNVRTQVGGATACPLPTRNESRWARFALPTPTLLLGAMIDLIVSLSPEAHHKALQLAQGFAVEVEYWPTQDPTLTDGRSEA